MMTVATGTERSERRDAREWVYRGGCGYLLRVVRGAGGKVVMNERGKPDMLDGEARVWVDRVREEIGVKE